jgi:hypothetical protein
VSTRSAICIGALAGLAACAKTTPVLAPSFATPIGIAVATFVPQEADQTGWSRLFISNFGEDTLQVLDLGSDLTKLDFVYSRANYFPRRIPAGPGPGDIAATPDGRYIVVLDVITEAVRLVDAGLMRLVRTADDEIAEFPLSVLGARPTALVAAPGACGTDCFGRFYVSLAEGGAILGFELRAAPNGATVVPTRIYDVGGEPVAMSINRIGTLLYVSDAASHDVIRLDLGSGFADRRDVGGFPGPLSVTPDGTLLVVGRPETRDLVILENASSMGFAVLDADPSMTPLPSCLRDCANPDPAICDDTHPADQMLCVAADGIGEATGAPRYGAVYIDHVPAKILALGEVPAELQALGAAAGEPALSNPCGESDQRYYSQYALVAALDGKVVFIGLRATSADPPSPTFISSTWCDPPSASATSTDLSLQPAEQKADPVGLGTVLDPCPAFPSDRRRFVCASDNLGDVPGGVVLSPGNPPPSAITFAWEGVLPQLDRQPGAGRIDLVDVPLLDPVTGADTGLVRSLAAFTDLSDGVDLSDLDIRPRELAPGSPDPYSCESDVEPLVTYRGDILDIVSTPLGEDACRIGLKENTARCNLERRIVGVDTDADGRARLFLCPDLTPIVSCFKRDGTISYQVRAGDQFLVTFGTRRPERLSPGDLLRPHFDPADPRAVGLRVRTLDVQSTVNACDRYDAAGKPLSMDPVLSRTAVWTLNANDRFTVVDTGYDLSTSASGGVAGLVPGALIVSPVGADEPVTFLTYSASNALLGFVGSDATGNRYQPGRYRLLK